MGLYKRYVMFQKQVCGQMRHPSETGAAEVEAFLTNLAVNRDVSPATQNQALNALVFLYREVLEMPLEGIDALRARRMKNLPVVLSVEEVKSLLAAVKGDAGLAFRLLYGCGLRVAEAQRLRIKETHLLSPFPPVPRACPPPNRPQLHAPPAQRCFGMSQSPVPLHHSIPCRAGW